MTDEGAAASQGGRFCAADYLDLPVFVSHALSERYPYASDRHHRFILEGARDVARALAERGMGTAFHLERPGHRGPHLKTLAARAALVVTEDLPAPPLTGWTRALRDAVDTPLWVVDTACILPMKGVQTADDRAWRSSSPGPGSPPPRALWDTPSVRRPWWTLCSRSTASEQGGFRGRGPR